MQPVCIDTGFLIALSDARDEHHARAAELADDFFGRARWLVPWPVLYESAGTRAARKGLLAPMLTVWSGLRAAGQVVLLPDDPYREAALRAFEAESDRRPLALADLVIREMLRDPRLPIAHFLTFDTGHYADVCAHRGILLSAGGR